MVKTGISLFKERRADAKIARRLAAWVRDRGYTNTGCGLEDVAVSLGVPPYRLSSYFSRNVPGGFFRWRTALRMEEAGRLLTERRMLSISAVGRLVGIPDKSNFRKLFFNFHGMTPSEWRLRHGGVG